MQDNEKNKNQKIASNPKFSVWVSASAGTGKTTVLVNRLLRLFLNDVEPSKILCLTYTNAGAIEMQNRIYRVARDWAVMPDNDLREKLKDLLDDVDENFDFNIVVSKAKKLFSKLIDSPIPLKIYTIHAFCQSVLKRFPIEAGIPPHFKIIEDSDVKILLKEAYQKLVHTLKSDKNIDYLDVFESFNYLMKNTPESNFENLIQTIIDGRDHFFELLLSYKTKSNICAKLKEKIFSGNPLAIDSFIDNIDLFKSNVLNHIPNGFIEKLKNVLLVDSGAKSLERLDAISKFLGEQSDVKKFDIYKQILLNKDETIPKKSILNKKSIDANPKFIEDIDVETLRVYNAVEFINSTKIYKSTLSILNVGLTLNQIYENLKRKRGVMDFMDLITTVKNLFEKDNISSWILYKLDGGISHILIDEAQDTSPLQWKIVDNLTSEFFTTGATEKNVKTFFSVGDRKQSIFSFQGANISLFEKYKNHFKEKIEHYKYPFFDLPLNRSYRSCKNILNVVDDVIKNSSGVLLSNEEIRHDYARQDSLGFVEVLPLIKRNNDKNDNTFSPPVKSINTFNADTAMADVLAKKIRYLLDNEYISAGEIDGKKYRRKIEPKDIMILVKNRKYADNITKALVEKNIPLAGKDKLSLSDNIAVEDLISLLKFVLFNYDDLSLAEVLKSPLYNLTDDDLFKLCYNRKSTLFERLFEFEQYENIAKDLQKLIEFSQTALPFEFFDYVLKVQNKMDHFISRLGIEVIDVLNGFLSQCLSYDNLKLGKSLSDFYEWFSLNEVEIKRNMEQVNNTVRIMTVHSSKGLEAPVVFLYNSNANLSSPNEKIIWSENFPIYAITNFSKSGEKFKQISELDKKLDEEEFYRLLYVAMTRARDRLYDIGSQNLKNSSVKTWYSCIKESILSNPEHKEEFDDAITFSDDIFEENKALVLGNKNEEGIILDNKISPLNISEKLPEFFNIKIDNVKENSLDITPISPLENSDVNKSLTQGKNIHKLLEYISKFNGNNIEQFIDDYLLNLEIENKELIKKNILELYNNPKFNFIFKYDSLSETEIITSENNITKILRVDKVVFDKDCIWIIDYKTDKSTSTIPSEYKKQLEKYKNAMLKIYPTKKIRTAILWINDLKFSEVI